MVVLPTPPLRAATVTILGMAIIRTAERCGVVVPRRFNVRTLNWFELTRRVRYNVGTAERFGIWPLCRYNIPADKKVDLPLWSFNVSQLSRSNVLQFRCPNVVPL